MKKSQLIRNYRFSFGKCSLLIPLTFIVCLAFSPPARAICNDGCGTGNNTYQGDGAGTTGSDNTAVGFNALFSNNIGYQNTAVGSLALFGNTDGYNNTAVGKTALQSNTTAIDCTAVGVAALQQNTVGNHNTAFGLSALTSNITGGQNTAIGTSASYYNNSGTLNTATGYNALQLNSSGSNNTANGASALFNATGSGNIGLGDSAGINVTTGGKNIEIGNLGTASDTNTIRIGIQGTQTATYVAGIFQAPLTGNALVVRVNNQGKLGTMASSARFKEAIKPMDKASEAILALQPVTFRYKQELDPEKVPQFGLVAEEVAKVNPDLVVRDDNGKPYTVRYEAVDAMLLNEFLKEHRKVEQLDATVAQQRKEIAALTASLKEQSAQIQKVTAQLAVDRPAPRVVAAGQ